eukprot:3987724-Lingulodinium_polyedra.AAC.1
MLRQRHGRQGEPIRSRQTALVMRAGGVPPLRAPILRPPVLWSAPAAGGRRWLDEAPPKGTVGSRNPAAGTHW